MVGFLFYLYLRYNWMQATIKIEKNSEINHITTIATKPLNTKVAKEMRSNNR